MSSSQEHYNILKGDTATMDYIFINYPGLYCRIFTMVDMMDTNNGYILTTDRGLMSLLLCRYLTNIGMNTWT